MIGLLPAVTLPASAADLTALYVSADGKDTNSGDSTSAPLRTLKAAFSKINSATTDTAAVTVYVMTDLGMDSYLSLSNQKKAVTVASYGGTRTVRAEYNGAYMFYLSSGTTLTLNDLILDSNGWSITSSLVYTYSAKLILQDTTLRGNGTAAHGLYLNGQSNAGSSGKMTGGSITGCKDKGVYVKSYSSFEMTGGSITDNNNGVYVESNSSFTMTGGSITGGKGNGVYVASNSSFTMTGGSITGNNTGVFVDGGGAVTLGGGSGAVRITGNNTSGVERNLVGSFDPTAATVETLADGSRIGVTVEGVTSSLQTFATSASAVSAATAACFVADQPGSAVEKTGDGKGLALRTAPFASGDVYVGGADAADGNSGTREAPVATLAEAFGRINVTGDDSISSFTVHVLGDLEEKRASFLKTAKPVTVTSDDGTGGVPETPYTIAGDYAGNWICLEGAGETRADLTLRDITVSSSVVATYATVNCSGGNLTLEERAALRRPGKSGYGVYLRSGLGSSLRMTGGSITGGAYGVVAYASTSFTMTGGSITGATTFGVEIRSGCTFMMTGGSITGNNTGVYVNSGVAVTLGDGARPILITGNQTAATGEDRNLSLGPGAAVTVRPLADRSRIGVAVSISSALPYSFTSDDSTAVDSAAAYFTGDLPGTEVVSDSGELVLRGKALSSNTVYVKEGGDDLAAGTPAAPLATLAGAFNRIACSTGSAYTIRVLSDLKVRVLPRLKSNKTVTIRSDNGSGGVPATPWVLQRGVKGVLFDLNNEEKLILQDITVDGNKTGMTNTNELVKLSKSATLTLDSGATLRNNNGGGVSGNGSDPVTLVMNSGASIRDNEGRGAQMAGTFTMNGGTITGNRAVGVASSGKFEMKDGSITGNTNGGGTGGGVYVGPTCTFTMTGGSITGNTAGQGGGVYVKGIFLMKGGSITGNTAGQGGGVYADPSKITVSGTPRITGNTNDSGGADNVCLNKSRFITIGSLSSGASIGVNTVVKPTGSSPVKFAGGTDLTDTHKGYFTPDDNSCSVDRPDTTMLQLKGTGDLYGTARTSAGKAVSGVNITVLNSSGVTAGTAVTNGQGSWFLNLTSSGTYTVKASTQIDQGGRPQRVTAINGNSTSDALTNGVSLTVTKGTPVLCDITVEQAVKVTFDPGLYGAVDSMVTYGDREETLTQPNVYNVTPGKRFVGWSTSKNATSSNTKANRFPAADTVYYAAYADKEYTVVYLDTGDAPVPAVTVGYDESGLLPTVSREGYTLKGWRVAGTDTAVTSDMKYGDIAPDADSVTLQAVWEIRSDIQVTLDANGSASLPATVGGAAKKVYTNRTYGDLIDMVPERNGYTFVGWSLQKTLEDAVGWYAPHGYVKVPDPLYVDSLLRDSDSAVTYYAIWKAGTVTVTYDPMGGEFETDEDGKRTGMPGAAYTVPEAPEREGYTFLGWFTTPTGNEKVTGSTIPTASTTYYAQWKANEVTLTLTATGGVPERQTIQGTYSDVVRYEIPIKDGYSFVGWKLPDNTTSYFIAFPAEDATYTAVFEKNQIVVAFNPMGGEFAADESGTRKGEPGDSYVLPDAPTREGYDFAGWYTTYACEEAMPTDLKIPAASVTYYAKWTPKDVTVTLNENYGDIPAEVQKTGKYGSAVDYATPEQEGYAFLGWMEDADADASSAVMSLVYPSQAKTYYAAWQQGGAVVLYNPMGGKLADADGDGRFVGVKDGTYTAPQNPTREGYTFKGWYTQPNGGGEKYEGNTFESAGNTTYYAFWEAKTITVTLNAGAGADPLTQNPQGETGAEVAYTIPTKDGYAFKGWKLETEPDASAVVSLVYPEANQTYVAVWEANSITVTFDADTNGGELSDGTQETQSGAPGGTLTVPTVKDREGYDFQGWFTLPKGGTKLAAAPTFGVQDATWYAQWKPKTITVTLNATGSDQPSQQISGDYDTVIQYTMPKKDGSAFVGWKVSGAQDSTAVVFPTYPAVNTTYEAVFKNGVAVVSFNANGGTLTGTDTFEGALNGTYTLPTAPNRTGYTFKGWNTAPDGGGDAPKASSTVTGKYEFPALGNTIYYAQWTAIEISVTLDKNYTGAPAAEVKTGSVGETVQYTMPTREGYAFKGWAETSNAAAGDFFPTFPEADKTLYAVWEAGSVTVLYDPMGGVFAGLETGDYSGTTGTAMTPPQPPTRDGYRFLGWFTKPTGGDPAPELTALPAKSVTYYAHWEAQNLSVTVTGTATYDGTAQKPAVTVKADAVLTEGQDYVLVYENNINACTNTAKVTAYGLNDYAGLKGEASFSIAKAEQTVTFAKGTSGLTAVYGEHYVNAASAEGGADISYSVDSTGLTAGTVTINASTGALTLTGVGAVTVKASAAESDNYKAGEASYTLTVNKATPKLTFEKSSIVCPADSEPITNPLTKEPEELSIEYALSGPDSVDEIAEIDPGTGEVTLKGQEGWASVTASFAGNEYYNTASATYVITVSNNAISYTVSGVRTKYDGTEHSIQVDVSVPTNAEVTYCATESGSYTADELTYTEAGTYPVYYKITAEGYSEVSGMALVVIEPLELRDAVVSGGTYIGSPVETTVTSLTVNTKNGPVVKTDLTDRDYTVTCYNNVAAGTAKAVITGIGNYTGTLVKDYTISPKALTDSSITVADISDQTYTGSAILPAVTVTDGDVTLAEGRDYTLTYANNTAVGTATVTVTGNGNYSGTVEKNFTITNSGAFTVVVVDSGLTYTGSAQKPTVLVYVGDKLLTEGTDYTLSGNSAAGAGSHTLTVTGKGNYAQSGSDYTPVQASWSIAKAEKTVSANDVEKAYGDAAFQNTVTLTPNDSADLTYVTGDPGVVTVGSDGTITIVSAGTATITIRAAETPNYKAAEGSFTVTVGPKAMTFAVEAIDDQTYTGSAIKPQVVVKDGDKVLTENVDYTLTYSDNTAVGTAKVTVTGMGSYDGSAGSQTFKIVANSNDFDVTLSEEVHIYDGTEQTPATVTVKYGGVTLTPVTHYILTYSNNVNAGTAVVTIEGMTGTAYAGLSSIRTFVIERKPLTEGMVAAIADQTYTGTAIRPEVTVTDGSATLVKDRDYSVTYGENLNVGTGTVTLTGQGNYTDTVNKTFNIVLTGTPVIQAIPSQIVNGK